MRYARVTGGGRAGHGTPLPTRPVDMCVRVRVGWAGSRLDCRVALVTHQSAMEHYHILGRVGEGAHGIVLKAKHIKVLKNRYIHPSSVQQLSSTSQTGELVALKKVPLRKLEDGIPNSALR